MKAVFRRRKGSLVDDEILQITYGIFDHNDIVGFSRRVLKKINILNQFSLYLWDSIARLEQENLR